MLGFFCTGGRMRRSFIVVIIMAVAVIELASGRPRNGALRLVNRGGPAHHGLLQVYHHGRWGTVCDDYFNHRAANVACREMGYPGGHFYGHGRCRRLHGRWVCGRGRIWLDNVRCRGNERRLVHCRRWPWGWHNCWHGEDVVLICKPRPKWWIEWSFKDSVEEYNFAPASWIYIRMWLRKPQSAQAVHYCYGRHPRHKQFLITLFANDNGKRNYHLLKDYSYRWSHPWHADWQNYPSYGLVDVIKRGVRCIDVVPWIKGVTCRGDQSDETPIVTEKIQCWEARYGDIPWKLDHDFRKLSWFIQSEVPQLVTGNATLDIPEQHRHNFTTGIDNKVVWNHVDGNSTVFSGLAQNSTDGPAGEAGVIVSRTVVAGQVVDGPMASFSAPGAGDKLLVDEHATFGEVHGSGAGLFVAPTEPNIDDSAVSYFVADYMRQFMAEL